MNKRLVSFSLWGDQTFYTDGAVYNAEAMAAVYPGWTARYYHDDSVPTPVLDKLKSFDCVELVRMPEATDSLAMFWRFYPMFDDTNVERFIVRDTDSTIGEREAAAVDEWIESCKSFHIIRDCESHNIPILGGTWGAIRGCIPLFEERMFAFLGNVLPVAENPRGPYHGQDQLFLSDVVWPHIRNDHTAHIRAGVPKLRFTPSDVELPAWAEGDRYVGMVG